MSNFFGLSGVHSPGHAHPHCSVFYLSILVSIVIPCDCVVGRTRPPLVWMEATAVRLISRLASLGAFLRIGKLASEARAPFAEGGDVTFVTCYALQRFSVLTHVLQLRPSVSLGDTCRYPSQAQQPPQVPNFRFNFHYQLPLVRNQDRSTSYEY